MMEAAIHVKPFGFDRVFHMPGGKEPPPVDTDDLGDRAFELEARILAMEEDHRHELHRARADAFQAGLDQARHDREAALLAAADAIHAAIDDIDGRLAYTTEKFMKDAAQVAQAAAEMLAGHAIALAPLRAMDEALDRVLGQVARGTRLTIRVNPDQFEDMERLLADRQGQERRQLSITPLADPAMAPGDAVIFWEEGGLAVDAAARREAVLAELGPFLEENSSR